MNTKQKLEVEEYDAPAYWASYLINGDDSGISAADRKEADEFIENKGLPFPVSCSDESHIGQFDGLMCDILTYQFLV